MSWIKAEIPSGAVRRRTCYVQAAFITAGLFDAILIGAGLAGIFAAPAAVGLHIVLVLLLVLTLSSKWLDAGGDIALFAFTGTIFAGPLAAFAALRIAGAFSAGEERRKPPNSDGLAADSDVEHLTATLRMTRAISADAAAPPSFLDIIRRGPLEQRLAVLAVVARNYHPEHRRLVDFALRSDSGSLRAQAAALMVSLSSRYRRRVQAALEKAHGGAEDIAACVRELDECLRSGFLEPQQEAAARDAAMSLCRLHDANGSLAENLTTSRESGLDAGDRREVEMLVHLNAGPRLSRLIRYSDQAFPDGITQSVPAPAERSTVC